MPFVKAQVLTANAIYTSSNGKYGDPLLSIDSKDFTCNSTSNCSVKYYDVLTNEEISKGILNFELSSNRMSIINNNNITIIDDSYNANYDSMRYAIKYLGSLTGRNIAVLGTMRELGDYTESLHKKIGKVVSDEDINILITVGEDSDYINEGAIEEGFNKDNSYHFTNNTDAINFINEIKCKDDNILVKASNSLNFKEIVEKIK